MPPKKIDRTAYFAAYYKKKVEKIGRKKMRSDNLKSKQKNRIKNNKRTSLASRKGCCSAGHQGIAPGGRYPKMTICNKGLSVSCKIK